MQELSNRNRWRVGLDRGSDGLHLTAESNGKVYDEVLKVLDDPAFAPTLKADQMRLDYPLFKDLRENSMAILKSWSRKM